MTLTYDMHARKGARWSLRRKLVIALCAAPALIYAPGFLLASPMGVATSLPFWAEARDYTCSGKRLRSLMVRVTPYGSSLPVTTASGHGCSRVVSFDDRDLDPSERPLLRADGDQRYVRIYTPFEPAQAQLPSEPLPDDSSSESISLARSSPAAAPPAPKPAPTPAWSRPSP